MSELTVEQRHEVYLAAIEAVKHEINENEEYIAVCDTLDELAWDLHGEEFECGRNEFPEWYAQEPSHSKKPNCYHNARGCITDYWWTQTSRGHKARLRALQRCVELTEQT